MLMRDGADLRGIRFASFPDQAGFLAQRDAIHFRLAGQDRGLAIEVREQMAQRHFFERVVHLLIGGAIRELRLQPGGQRRLQGIGGSGRTAGMA